MELTADSIVTADLIDGIRRLVECESPSHDTAALERSAQVTAELGTEILGTEPERVDVNGTPHLRWSHGPTRVLVLAHHDTVWPMGSLATHPYDERSGVLTGPGCFDMKTGLVMALHAIAALPADTRAGVTLLVTGDEETGSTNSRALIENEARGARAALVLEASADGGAVKIERKGVSLYEVRVTGRAAHAGLEPEKGVNATLELAHLALALATLGDADAGTSVTPTVLRAGATTNTVPAAGALAVDARARTVAEQERVDQAIRALTPTIPGARIEILGGPNRPPFERAAAMELFERAAALAARLGQAPLEAVAVGGGSDGNFTAGIGTPTLDGLGAVGGGAHADDEHVIAAELAPRTRLLAELISDLAGDDA